jgi:hypothetical protein
MMMEDMEMQQRKAVLVTPRRFGNKWGYDLCVTDARATVQDYLDAMNRAVEDLPLSRGRKKVRVCAGCDLCCAERAPLTWIDVLNLKKHLRIRDGLLQHTLDRVGFIMVDGPVVDITLRRDDDERCAFLNRQSRLCTIYPARPLVCQTFICCPATRRAVRLREWVVNHGEDELVRQWLIQAAQRGTDPVFHEGYRPKPKLGDWKPNAFTGKKHYSRVLLKELLPPGVWKQVYVPCST